MKQCLSALLYLICSVALLFGADFTVRGGRYNLYHNYYHPAEILSAAAPDEIPENSEISQDNQEKNQENSEVSQDSQEKNQENGEISQDNPGENIEISGEVPENDAAENQESAGEIADEKILKRPRLIAHRGYTASAPENTLAAFEAAANAGYDCIETDVRFTSDGKAVLLHRPVVDDTSNGTGEIANMTLEQARALDFGAGRGEEYAGTRIPTLEEGLAFCRGLGLDVYLELKVPEMTEEQYKNIAFTVQDCGMRDHVTFISFYLTCLEGMAARDTGYHFRFLTSSRDMKIQHDSNDATVKQAMEYFWSIQETAGSVGISWNYTRLTPELAAEVKNAGLILELWTVDDLNILRDMPLSCSAITTNIITNDLINLMDSPGEIPVTNSVTSGESPGADSPAIDTEENPVKNPGAEDITDIDDEM